MIGYKYMIYKLLACRYLNDWKKFGRYCDSHLKVVTLALKFKAVVITQLIQVRVFTFLYVYIAVLNYGHAFGVLVSCFTHTHVNCILECHRLLFMCMLIYQMMVESILIFRRSSTGCLVWLLKCFHMKVVNLLWS